MDNLRINTIKEINELKDQAIELGYDWPSIQLGINITPTKDLINFLYELEALINYNEEY